MKSWLKLKLGLVGIGSNIAQNHLSSLLRSPIWSLVAPMHMQGWLNYNLGQVGVGSIIVQNHSSGP